MGFFWDLKCPRKGGEAEGQGEKQLHKTSKMIDDLKEGDQDLYLQLKELRKTIAAKRTVPAYIIFSDKSLVDMALNKPITLEEFGEIFGVGEEKKKKFGKQFIEFIKLAH